MWLIPLADEMQGVQVKLYYPLTVRDIPEHLRGVSCIGAMQIDITFTFTYKVELGRRILSIVAPLKLLLTLPALGSFEPTLNLAF